MGAYQKIYKLKRKIERADRLGLWVSADQRARALARLQHKIDRADRLWSKRRMKLF